MQPRACSITVQNTGARFSCREDEFVLAAMLRARCGPVHQGCCGGGCGICKARVLAGTFRIHKRMSRAHISEQEQDKGTVLLCCIKPCTDMTITQEKPEK